MTESELDAILALHRSIGHVPTTGEVNIYNDQHVLKRNINKEREFLMNHKIVGVVRIGHAFMYTFDTGQKYLSFVHPHKIQWAPGSWNGT